MTDIQDMRARLREDRGRQPVVAARASLRLPFGLLAGAAVVLGFLVVMFAPKIYSVQRTAALPAFKESKERIEQPEPVAVTPPTPAAPPQYAGKNIDDIASLADGVCAQRAAAAKGARHGTDGAANGLKIVENEKLNCFLSEATIRFCAGAQKRKATADIINYFKGIEYTNATLNIAQKVLPVKTDPAGDTPRKATVLTPDPRVVEAIEGLMRAGYLTKGHREDIAASVPRAYKERFAQIAGNKPPCPETPWWAVWK
jgi:hypothetical protein